MVLIKLRKKGAEVMLIQNIRSFCHKLQNAWHSLQSISYPEPQSAEECARVFPARLKGKVSPEKWFSFWQAELEMRETYKQVCVPNDFPFLEGDAVMQLSSGFETIESYLWIRKEQTLREVAEQRGYVLPESWDDQA